MARLDERRPEHDERDQARPRDLLRRDALRWAARRAVRGDRTTMPRVTSAMLDAMTKIMSCCAKGATSQPPIVISTSTPTDPKPRIAP